MGKKNKAILSLLIALIMVVAIGSSFWITLFGGKHREIILPDPTTNTEAPGADSGAGTDNLLKVEVTPETVQSVIATLERPENYARSIVIEVATGADTVGRFLGTVRVDGEWTQIEMSREDGRLPVQHTIFHDTDTGGTVYRWYAGDAVAQSWPAMGANADLMQYIPTYEDILSLEEGEIVAAGFVEWRSMPCIYVETVVDELSYLERYWVSVTTGLLVGAETAKADAVVLRMEADDANTEVLLQKADFALPDGTVLYEYDAP